jgi:hypothetical protein
MDQFEVSAPPSFTAAFSHTNKLVCTCQASNHMRADVAGPGPGPGPGTESIPEFYIEINMRPGPEPGPQL